MNVLAIGNSFSQDATRYLHQIAKADKYDLQVTNLYIGGCPLERHYRNMLSGARAYGLQYDGIETGFNVSLDEAIFNRHWDVITLQQVSHFSFKPETYEPYLSSLAAYVRKCAPSAKLYIHQTWSYEEGCRRLTEELKMTSAEMLAGIVKTYGEMAKMIEADGIIRSGEMMFSLSKLLGGGIHRDTYHATYGLGRYALGLLWYKTLTGASVLGNTFCDFDQPIEDEKIALVKQYVETI